METRELPFQELRKREKLTFCLTLTVGITLSLAMRYWLLPFISKDYLTFNSLWYARIKSEGFAAFKTGFTNYTPFYLYLLFFMAKLFPNLPNLIAVKVPSILSDFVGAFFAYQTVSLRFHSPQASRRWIPLLAFFAVLFAPTVLLNGAAWGQTDMIYTCFLVASVYFLAKENSYAGMLFFGLSFAMKFQSVFLIPCLVVLFLKKRIAWPSLILVPLVYLLTILPSKLAGRGLRDLLTIYQGQAQSFENHLTLNMPNLYTWLPDEPGQVFFLAGIALTSVVCCLFIFMAYRSPRKLDGKLILQLALTSTLLVPFFLPRMHERYYFSTDVLSILYGFYYPKRFYVPVTINLVSFFAYWPFLFDVVVIPLYILALFAFVILCILLYFLGQSLYQGASQPAGAGASPVKNGINQ